MTEEKKPRRPKAGSALGNIHETKIVAEAMIEAQRTASREKTERLRAMRLGLDDVSSEPAKENG